MGHACHAENPGEVQRPILADIMPGTTVCRVIRPRDLLHALGGVAALLPLLLLLTVPSASPDSPAHEPLLTPADEQLLMDSSELHQGDSSDKQGPSSPRASTAVLQSPHRDEKSMLQELSRVLSGRGAALGPAPGFNLLEILEMIHVRALLPCVLFTHLPTQDTRVFPLLAVIASFTHAYTRSCHHRPHQ